MDRLSRPDLVCIASRKYSSGSEARKARRPPLRKRRNRRAIDWIGSAPHDAGAGAQTMILGRSSAPHPHSM